jgi:hypothetical protein
LGHLHQYPPDWTDSGCKPPGFIVLVAQIAGGWIIGPTYFQFGAIGMETFGGANQAVLFGTDAGGGANYPPINAFINFNFGVLAPGSPIPQTISGQGYTGNADLYSFGNTYPFNNSSNSGILPTSHGISISALPSAGINYVISYYQTVYSNKK